MLRIIKQGNTKPKVYKCVCHDCGCVFETDETKTSSVQEYCCYYRYAKCPCCGKKEVMDVKLAESD